MASGSKGQFDGMIHVLRFNWPYYFFAAVGAVVSFFLFLTGPELWLFWPVIVAGIAGVYFSAASIAASHYIYDRSHFYEWSWIKNEFARDPSTAVNIHAGYDESTRALQIAYPDCEFQIIDFFEADKNTEASILRARQYSSDKLSASVPVKRFQDKQDSSMDAAFCLLSAHEIRDNRSQTDFFRNIHRILRSSGRLIVAEHMRNLPNFLAYGPGFMHFFSRQSWIRNIQAGGFRVTKEFSITPFIRIFICEHA